MKLDELISKNILESPLPPDWDETVFSTNNSFNKMFKYALNRSTSVGSGSSRVAFIIPYKGRDTILKVAKNRKGLAQNEAEAEILSDHYAKSRGVIIPIIDYDEKNSQPTWIHTEMAEEAKISEFKSKNGFSLLELENYINHILKGRTIISKPNVYERLQESELANGVVDLVSSYNLAPGDISRITNWGKYKGDFVLLDIGLTTNVFDLHYKFA